MTLVLPNPWSRERWNITAQGKFARDHGMALATVYAHAVGVEPGATKPAPDAPSPTVVRERTVIRNKIFTTGRDGGGSSGSGAPE